MGYRERRVILVDNIVLGDSRDLDNYPDGPYHLTITSPPYFVGKKYEKDYSYEEYIDLLKDVFTNVAAKTIEGGKIAINIADIAAFSKVTGEVEEGIEVSRIIADHMKEQDCRLMSRIIWHKDDPWQNSQHVGYHDGIPATYTRVLPNWEYIWVFYKGKSPKRPDLSILNEGTEYERVFSVTDSIHKEDWKKWVSAVWSVRSVSSNRDHPAKFPEDFARRLVLLYSVDEDIVFDPFLGSGTTAVAAYNVRRKFAGIERDPDYHKLAVDNIKKVINANTIEAAYSPPTRYKPNKLF
jgi:site-specific DNA-methyltransferase (adenine-specific)